MLLLLHSTREAPFDSFQQKHITLKRLNFAYFCKTMLGFFSRPIRRKKIFLLKYGIRELKASLSVKIANLGVFQSSTLLQVTP